MPTRYVVLDTETTGLTADDRIIEIGAILLEHRRPVKTFHTYINPENRNSHPDALRVHGIEDKFLKDKPKFSDIHNKFLDFVNDSTLVIHNAAFDMRFLQAELDRVAYPVALSKLCPVCDTVALARKKFPGQKCNLDALCRRFGIDISHRTMHGALKDADLLVKVFLQLTHQQETLGLAQEQQINQISDKNTIWEQPIAMIQASKDERSAHQAMLKTLALDDA